MKVCINRTTNYMTVSWKCTGILTASCNHRKQLWVIELYQQTCWRSSQGTDSIPWPATVISKNQKMDNSSHFRWCIFSWEHQLKASSGFPKYFFSGAITKKYDILRANTELQCYSTNFSLCKLVTWYIRKSVAHTAYIRLVHNYLM